jgi:hypothetical protein
MRSISSRLKQSTAPTIFMGLPHASDDADASQAKLICDAQTQAFLTEDNPMIEAVEDRMGGAEFWSLRPAILPSDAAGIRVRRRLGADVPRRTGAGNQTRSQ